MPEEITVIKTGLLVSSERHVLSAASQFVVEYLAYPGRAKNYLSREKNKIFAYIR